MARRFSHDADMALTFADTLRASEGLSSASTADKPATASALSAHAAQLAFREPPRRATKNKNRNSKNQRQFSRVRRTRPTTTTRMRGMAASRRCGSSGKGHSGVNESY